MADFLLACTAFAISLALSWVLAKPGSALSVLDYPSGRSLHDRPIPRSGGVAVLAGFGVSGAGALFLYGAADGLWALGFGALLLALVSFWDDVAPLPALARLGAHFAAGGLLLAGGFGVRVISFPVAGSLPLEGFPAAGIAGYFLTLLFVVWFTNLYNFMDGMDGFAGGVGVIGFLLLAMLGWKGGETLFTVLSFIIAAANLGFLVMNRPPARIFLGDVGSIPMGFLAAGFSLWGVREGLFELWAPILIFSPFIVDATVTVMGRMARGERFWEAHRSHYYQRLVLAGWGHGKTVLGEYLLMAGTGTTAVLLVLADNENLAAAGLLGWGAVYVLLGVSVRRVERRRERGEIKKETS